jgi:hypothetical protein
MAPSTFRAAAGLTAVVVIAILLGTIMVLRYSLKDTPLARINMGLVGMIAAGALACCVIGPLIVRLILWRMPYVTDGRK